MRHLIKTYAGAIATGLLLFFAFPKWHLFPLAWVALVPLLLSTLHRTPRAAAAHFFVAGWIFHTLTLQWLVTNIYWAGGWAVVGQQLLCVALSLFWAAVGALWMALRVRAPKHVGALALAVLWHGMEYLHATLFTGFGWCALGYSQGPDLPLLQWASLGGVGLISFLLVLFNTNLALAIHDRGALVPRATTMIALLLLSHGIGYLLLRPAAFAPRPFQAALFQSNFPQEMKWDRRYTREMVLTAAESSRSISGRARVDLHLWPEALVMTHYAHEEVFPIMRDLVLDTETPLLTGTERMDGTKIYNSCVLIERDGKVAGYYDKVRLALMGEYIPYEESFPFLRHFTLGTSTTPGDAPRLFSVGDRSLGPLICFEVLFAPMAETLRGMGADALVVLTNLGWFGASNAIAQEHELARLRAVETRLPLIHVSNTGYSGVFDPYGRFQVIGREYRPDITLDMTFQQRFGGVVPVPLPGRRPIPFGPRYLPGAGLVLSALLIGSVFLRKRMV
jgi:apolipoprotein N-acyltransferase